MTTHQNRGRSAPVRPRWMSKQTWADLLDTQCRGVVKTWWDPDGTEPPLDRVLSTMMAEFRARHWPYELTTTCSRTTVQVVPVAAPGYTVPALPPDVTQAGPDTPGTAPGPSHAAEGTVAVTMRVCTLCGKPDHGSIACGSVPPTPAQTQTAPELPRGVFCSWCGLFHAQGHWDVCSCDHCKPAPGQAEPEAPKARQSRGPSARRGRPPKASTSSPSNAPPAAQQSG